MSELVQDVQFQEGDSREEHIRKLRVLQDEVVRMSRAFSQITVSENGVLELGQVEVSGGFIQITVNGQPGRIAVLLP